MKAFELVRKGLLYITVAALCLAGLLAAQEPNQDEEVQMGQEVFNELKAKGEIIESSPLYDQLRPIADAQLVLGYGSARLAFQANLNPQGLAALRRSPSRTFASITRSRWRTLSGGWKGLAGLPAR